MTLRISKLGLVDSTFLESSKNQILLESNPLISRILVLRLAISSSSLTRKWGAAEGERAKGGVQVTCW